MKNKIIITVLMIAIIAFLFLLQRFISSGVLHKTTLMLSLMAILLCISMLIGLNPKGYDNFLKKINILKFTPYPKDEKKRLRLHKDFSHMLIILFSIIILIIIITGIYNFGLDFLVIYQALRFLG